MRKKQENFRKENKKVLEKNKDLIWSERRDIDIPVLNGALSLDFYAGAYRHPPSA